MGWGGSQLFPSRSGVHDGGACSAKHVDKYSVWVLHNCFGLMILFTSFSSPSSPPVISVYSILLNLVNAGASNVSAGVTLSQRDILTQHAWYPS